MSKTIAEFLSRYEKEYDFYQNLSTHSAEKIKNELSRSGIRAIVSSRAKSTARLDVKLEDRNKKKNYKTVDEIYDDIVDLAGIRVALYFPGDIKTVEEIIKKNFKIHLTKRFPEDSKKKTIGDYIKVFDGYSAVHFRVSINDESRYGNNHCVEIQVASVLMHAWSEVEHDLIYKPLQGDLSYEELMILDEINGLVLSGNIALERLQKAGQNRVNNEESNSLLNHYDLASFLVSKIHINENLFDFRKLFLILKAMDINKKDEVTKILEGIKNADSTKKSNKRSPGYSFESILTELTIQKTNLIIKTFTSHVNIDSEIVSDLQEMAWRAIASLDPSGSVSNIRKIIDFVYFEYGIFGVEYLQKEYNHIMNVSNIDLEELEKDLKILEDFNEDMKSGHKISQKNIDDFIRVCQKLNASENLID